VKYISNYIGAFIDLLGQSSRLSEYDTVPRKIDENFKQYLRSTYGRVKLFRDGFFTFLRKHNRRFNLPLIINRIRMPRIKIKASGDSLIIYSSLFGDGSKNLVSILSVDSILTACALNFVIFLANKRPFRGGIDIGVGIEDQELGIYGSVVNKSYQLESKHADYPRIVIGKTLLEYLQNNFNIITNKKAEKKGNLLRSFFSRKIMDTILKDEFGVYFLDVLNDQFIDIAKQSKNEGIYYEAYKAVIESLEEYRNKDEKIFKKYVKLKEYFDSKKTDWGKIA